MATATAAAACIRDLGEPSTAAKAPAARAIVKYFNFIFPPAFLKRPRLTDITSKSAVLRSYILQEND